MDKAARSAQARDFVCFASARARTGFMVPWVQFQRNFLRFNLSAATEWKSSGGRFSSGLATCRITFGDSNYIDVICAGTTREAHSDIFGQWPGSSANPDEGQLCLLLAGHFIFIEHAVK